MTNNPLDAAQGASMPPTEAPHSATMRAQMHTHRHLINALGFGGLLPFYGLAATVAWGPNAFQEWALAALAIYAATIVSFIGGLSWAFALLITPTGRTGQALLIWSVTPPLLAAACFLAQSPARLWLLVMVLAIAWIADNRFAKALQLPSAWIQLRTALSLLAIGALAWAASNLTAV
ncbi:DUF3429 domain-containing protein [Burkholderiaceae bacterium]|nr:DUF3429 domain-containing protein [Burkholderiaceae bacterium]